MAWVDLFTRTTGDVVTSEDWTLLKNALLERTGWVGDSTENTNANNIDVSQGASITAAKTTEFQDIIEAIVGNFARPGSAYAVGSAYGSWSWATLAQYIYDNHGGELSGIGKSGSTYDWIRRPTRDTSLLLGNPQSADLVYYEHIRGIVYALDYLRWLHTNNATSSPTIFRLAKKEVGYDYTSAALAWAAMKADTPAIANDTGPTNLGCDINQLFTWYNSDDYRILYPMEITYPWLVGYAPASWADGKFLIKTDVGATFLGPFTLKTNATNSAAGAYSTGSAFDASFTIAAANTLEEFTVDNPDNHPKSTGTIYVLHYNPTYDGASPGVFSELCGFTAGNFDMILKPTTIYGT